MHHNTEYHCKKLLCSLEGWARCARAGQISTISKKAKIMSHREKVSLRFFLPPSSSFLPFLDEPSFMFNLSTIMDTSLVNT